MTKLKLTLFSLFIFLPNTIFSQLSISGQIKNQNNKIAELLEVQLKNKDSINVKSELTNNEGKFLISTEKGEYSLIVKQLGNVLYTKKINLNQNIDLGIIQITEKQLQLKEVVVDSKKKLIERKVDRLVFNVENSISASGGDAIDALKVTPGLNVNNNSIGMIGKSKMSVMIDNRLIQLSEDDLINYLKTIKSDDIKNIEVITNPPAKYDAEGNSGIVNIKLKKIKSNAWSSSFRSSFQQATYAKGGLGTSFNYQKNKFSLSSGLNYTKGSNRPIETEKIEYPNQNWESENKIKDIVNNLSGKLSVDYKINEKITFGIQYVGSFGNPENKDFNNTRLSNINNQTTQTIITNLINNKNNRNHSLNFHSLYDIDTLGKKLSIDVDYFNFNKKNNQVFETNDRNLINSTNSFSSVNNNGKQNIKNYSMVIDMEHPLKWASLNYGGKMSYTNTSNDVFYYDLSSGIPIFDISQSNQFNYTENNQALYFSASKKFAKDKWETKLGLRFENTETKGMSITLNQTNNVSYSNLFPTAYITFTPNESNSFSLDYGKRINRPKYSMLNPFRLYNNPFSYIEGNPFLQPSYSHNISLTHTFKNNLNSSIFYSLENNGYSTITLINQNSINQVTTLLNYYTTENIGLNESYTFNKYKGWESYNSASISYSKTTSNNPNTRNKVNGFNSYISSINSFVFNKSKTLLSSLDLTYYFPSVTTDVKNETVFTSDIGLKYLLLKKALVLNFSITDIFKTNSQKWTQTINSINIYRTNYDDAQSIKVSISYKFGNNKLKSKEEKNSNSDEKGRATGN